MSLTVFKRKSVQGTYDPEKHVPVLHCSICNGEQVAGFRDRDTGHFEEIMLIKNSDDLESFRTEYGITGEIKKEY